MSTDCVQVAVRIRPLVGRENDQGMQSIVRKSRDEPQVVVGEGRLNEVFTFNHVFDQLMPQKMVYDDAIKGMLDKLFQGYNVTILAYGQTGSGKTFTMGTNHKDSLTESEIGVIPRAMNDIFHRVTTSQTHSFEVKCSFIELYQENVYDLLSTKAREDTVVDIREDANKEIVIPGLTETKVLDAEQTISCLMKGSLGRATGATAMNSQSSRSHAIFTVTVHATPLEDATQTTSAKFHLVDLAGSERSKKTKATGVRFDEGVKINQGLLALGNVISALGSGAQGGHIKYRDSKLTRLLQDSLGGNSITLMIACVSPADNNYDETISTLRYADRAKKIKNKPIVNQDPHVAEIKRLNAKILELQMQLYGGFEAGTKEFNDAVNIRKRRVSAAFSPAGKLYALKTINGQKSIDETVSLEQQVTQLTQKCRKLEVELQNSLNDVANYEMKSLMADEAVEKSLEKLKLMQELVVGDVDDDAANRQRMVELLREMEELFEKYNDENKTNRLTCSSASGSPVSKSSGERDSLSSHEIVRDRHINKQVQLTNELRQVISNIALKEQLLSYVERQTDDGNQTVKDVLNSTYEDRIQKLEEELKEAKAREKKAKTSQISAKIAEERRRKVVELEQQLNELKKQNRKQNKELQALGSKDKQVQALSQEIVEARKERVRLVREMRKEAENFKRTQQDLHKEVNRIKEEDRKLKNEMIRKEKLHERQINVQKRKYDEIAVLNKRFKEALDRQVKAKLQRNERKGITKDFKSIVEHEMEVFRSVVDSKATIDHLLRERGELNQKLKQLKKEAAEEERNGVTAAETGESTLEQIKVLEDDIFMKNENIRALREKIPADDHVKRLVDEFNDNVTSLVDSRQIIQKMVDYFAQAIQSSQEEKMMHLDTKATNELMQDQINRLMAKYEELQQSYEVKNRQVERFYGDHLSLLLNNVNQRNRNGGGQAQEEAGNGMVKHAISQHFEALRNELDEYKAKYEALEAKNQKGKAPKKRYATRNSQDADDETYMISDEDEEEEEDLNDSDADPSWRKTPMQKRRRMKENSIDTSNNSTATSAPVSDTSSRKRGSEGNTKCKCSKSGCTTKVCSCRKLGGLCTDACGCVGCHNRATTESDSENDRPADATFKIPVLKESNSDNEHYLNGTFTVTETPEKHDTDSENVTPKRAKLSESEMLDVTTPIYPFANKKRQPFLQL